MMKFGILSLGVSAAVFSAMLFSVWLPGRAFWPTVMVGGTYVAISLLLFFSCKCDDEPKARPGAQPKRFTKSPP